MSKATSLKALKPKIKTVQLHSQFDREDKLTTEDGTPITIDLHSLHSAAFLNATIQKARNEISATATEVLDPAWTMKENIKLAAALVVGWAPAEFFGGEFSPEVCLEILNDGDLRWLIEQIQQHAAEQEGFFGN